VKRPHLGRTKRACETRQIRARRRSGRFFSHGSAAPPQAETVSAVGFYFHHGFAPTDESDPALFEQEPEDIHMILEFWKL
jgi:hypothetical protein